MYDLVNHTDTINKLLARYGVKFGIYKNNTFKEDKPLKFGWSDMENPDKYAELKRILS